MWLSKLRSLLGYPKYSVPYYNNEPKRDPNFDNHPCSFPLFCALLRCIFLATTSLDRLSYLPTPACGSSLVWDLGFRRRKVWVRAAIRLTYLKDPTVPTANKPSISVNEPNAPPEIPARPVARSRRHKTLRLKPYRYPEPKTRQP